MTISARIGIVSWNTADDLDRCLSALPAAADGLAYRVVVVDNASSDRSVEVARSHPGVDVHESARNDGYAAAMNDALRDEPGDSQPDVLIALNPDTECPPGGLRVLAEALLSEPGIGLAVPALRYPDGVHQPSTYRFPSPSVSAAASFLPLSLQRGRLGRRYGLEAASPPSRPLDVDWAIGAVHVIRRTALGGRPPYNDRWFMYSEDLDLCWVLASEGWRRRLYPSVVVTHVANAAGRQAWGAERTERWLEATYDWYRLRRGPVAARRWAAVNTAGAAYRLAQAAVGRRLGATLQPWQQELRPALAVHLGALRGRPAPAVPSQP